MTKFTLSLLGGKIIPSVFLTIVIFSNLLPAWSEGEFQERGALSLGNSMNISLNANPSIAKQKAVLKGYQAHVWNKTTEFLPKLGTVTEYTYYHGYTRLGTIFGLGVNDDATYEIRYLNSNLHLDYTIPWSKELGEYMAAVYTLKAEEASYEDIEQELMFNIKHAYFSILRTQKLVKVNLEGLKRVNSHLADVEHLYELGAASQVDILKAKMEQAKVKQQLTKAQMSLKLSKANFNSLLARNLDADVHISDISEPPLITQELEYYLIMARINNPHTKKIQADIKQSRAELFKAQSLYFPEISIMGNAGGSIAEITSYQQFADYDVKTKLSSMNNLADVDPAFVIGVTAKMNIWDWGETQSQIREAKSKVNALIETSKLIKDMIALDIRAKYFDLEAKYQEMEASQAYLNFAEENFRITKIRFGEGLATNTSVLDAQNELTQAQTQYYNTLYDLHIAKAALERATGIISIS